MGYIIVGDGGAAGVVGKAISVPYNKPDLAAAHALAGQYLGMRFIYREKGGSGTAIPVPTEMIRAVKHLIDVPRHCWWRDTDQRASFSSSVLRCRRNCNRKRNGIQ